MSTSIKLIYFPYLIGVDMIVNISTVETAESYASIIAGDGQYVNIGADQNKTPLFSMFF